MGGEDDAVVAHHPHRELAAAVLVGIPGRVAEAQVEGADAGRQDAVLQNADRPDDQRWLRWRQASDEGRLGSTLICWTVEIVS